jgi:alpha-beta hydrolase superfamily lysophospholipase
MSCSIGRSSDYVVNTMRSEAVEIRSSDGHMIHGMHWRPQEQTGCVIQVFHGLGEHHARYQRFAELASVRGIAVVAHDHRGHGSHAEVLGHLPGNSGWQALVADGLLVNDMIGDRYPGTPIVLLGHSMGSFVAQSFSLLHEYRLTALVLSASNWPALAKIIPGRLLARIEGWRLGALGTSTLLNKIGFGDFNGPFEPARTELDWLSRDESEVDKYIEDPLCGGPYSCGLWQALLGGLRTIASDIALQRIRAELPILLTSGADDPVGGEQGVNELAMHYTRSGHSNVTVKTYPGGRHEMFNETNRGEFSNDVLNWVESQYQE